MKTGLQLRHGRLRVQARYLWALMRRFKVTFLLLALVQLGGSAALLGVFHAHALPLSVPQAMGATYFLMMGQPVLALPDSWAAVLIAAAIPPLGIIVVADGLVRFGYLFFAKHRNDKEWIAVLAQTFRDHVVLCGAGRVGFRVLEQLRRLELDVIVVERNEKAAFVQSIRNLGVPLLVVEGAGHDALAATHITQARAIVCATDDDLSNLNLALDARRLNPRIHVVMRLFDDDLVSKVRDAFNVEAMSTSALAAPAFAAAALDPSVRTSFEIEGRLMVVAELRVDARLAGKTVAALQDELRIAVLMRARPGEKLREALTTAVLVEGDVALVQAPLEDYERLRGRRAVATLADRLP